MRTKCLEPLRERRARFGSSNLLLTIPRRYFCYGSSEVQVMFVCIFFNTVRVFRERVTICERAYLS